MKTLKFVLVALFAIIVSSCLTVETKKYTFEMTGKGTGHLTIKYVNIFSQKDDSTDVSAEDFDELISEYINGSKVEESFPLATNIKKRLFEENGVLCGEVTMDFASLEAVRLYQFDKKSPFTFSISGTIDSESFENSNGTLGSSDFMNVVFWSPKTKKLEVTTSVNTFDEDCVPLIHQFRKWK